MGNSSVKVMSLSPNSSLIKNSSNDFSHVRMSSPNKEEANVPEFNPPLEKNCSKQNYFICPICTICQICIICSICITCHICTICSKSTNCHICIICSKCTTC